jgi:hypothetical protein
MTASPQKLERRATVVHGAEGPSGSARSVARDSDFLTRPEPSGVRLQRRMVRDGIDEICFSLVNE